jgi:ATPase family associated with various cellular activities (AAA)/LAGLIDADG-like domain
MLTLEQCLRASRPLTFVTCESDIEVLRYLKDTFPKNNFYVYSTTFMNGVKLKDLLEKKFQPQDTGKNQSTFDFLDSVYNRTFKEATSIFDTYIFLDCDTYIKDPQNVRKIKDIVTRYQADTEYTVNMVFLSQNVCVPPLLERLSEVVYFDLPSEEQLKALSDHMAGKDQLDIKKPSDDIVINLKGLTLFEVEQAYVQSWQIHGDVNLDFIRNFKKSAIAKTDLLSLLESDVTFDDIGGMETLKNWIVKSYGGWTVEGRKYGLPMLKGLLMVGLPGCGKAQPLDSIVFTPKGPIKMGDVKIGTKVLTPNGNSTKVIKIFPQGEVDVYKITFEDGTAVECTKDHLWKVHLRDRRHVADTWVVPTSFLMDKVIGKYGKDNNIYIDVPVMARMEQKRLPIDPYVLGALLGDGCFKTGTIGFTSMDQQIVNKFKSVVQKKNCNITRSCGGSHGRAKQYYIGKSWKKRENRFTKIIEKLGLMGKGSHEKFIPEEYLYASHEQRVKLLHGLMDTDGSVCKSGTIEYSTSSQKLSQDFKILVESLGGLCFINERETYYKKDGVKIPCKKSYRCFIRININPFSLNRKKNKIIKRTKYSNIRRVITSIELIGKKQCQCIAIDDLQNLYMTNNYVVTHNSLTAKALGNIWHLPVISFDPGKVFSSRVGESEHNIRRVLKIVEGISPAVLMIDEIEKAFAGSQSSTFSDSGVTARVIGSFLNWLQDCTKPVFTIATSNNIQYLPPELIQRFDEKFFVNLPTELERIEIFRIHLKKVGRDPEKFDLETLSVKSKDLSGREIEQTIREAMYDAFYAKKEIDTKVILNVLDKKTNLLTTMSEQLNYLLEWVGWSEEKNDGIRARFASVPDKMDMKRVKNEIENLCKDIEKKKPYEGFDK